MSKILKSDWFELDTGRAYSGYHNPNFRWNGWACPLFEKEVALNVIENEFNPYTLASILEPGVEFDILRYDQQSDSIMLATVVVDNGQIVDAETGNKVLKWRFLSRGVMFDTADGRKRLYDIGRGIYCWCESERYVSNRKPKAKPVKKKTAVI